MDKNEKDSSISRRRFIASAAVATGGLLLGATTGSAEAPKAKSVDIESLKKACKGRVTFAGESGFGEAIHGDLWNKLIPDRAPDVVVRVADEEDVVAAVKFARANKLKVTVRGGGHNWAAPSLRTGGMLIDLSLLNKVISIDENAMKAVVQPIISNRDSQKLLNPKGLTFPCGHCPTVKLSGFLLGGGLPWNPGVWGYACESLEAVELVTAEGKRITATKDENVDYYWAAKGTGFGFFGVALRYHLKLHPLPKAIHGSAYWYSLDDAEAVATWLGDNAKSFTKNIELSMFLLTAPPEMKAAAAKNGGKVCLVTATCFADTPTEAKTNLAAFKNSPVNDKCLSKTVDQPTNFEGLFDAAGPMWPPNIRCRPKSTFSNAKPQDLIGAMKEHFTKTPSEITVMLVGIFTGGSLPAPLPDAAVSIGGAVYAGLWTQWKDASDDAVNTEWYDQYATLIKPYVANYYIGESDQVRNPSETTGAFSSANFKKIADLRDKHDPDRVFFGYFDGLADKA
ncbi:MAG: FAD-binding protein [Chthoniobacterales bacterium]